ncbi:MAG TPA: Gfo/Idh/MocA family oxidoreductase [Ktedonobacterales bacterium]
MANDITWGVLGAGYIARVAMVPALMSLPDVQLLAIAGRDPERAAALADAYAIPRVYNDYQGLLDDPDIDCVYIALANDQHRLWTERAADAGKHVLCEKPLGRNAAEAQAMRAACEQAGVALMEALMYRFHPRIEQALELVAQGVIGRPRGVEASFCFTLGDLANYRMHPAQGGGALLDVGGYCVSAARFFLQGEPLAVRAEARYADTGADLAVSALLNFSARRSVHITCAFDTAEYQRVTIIGTTAALELPYAFTAWRDDEAPMLIHHGKRIETIMASSADPYARMADAFGRAAMSGEAVPYSLDDSLGVARALDAIAHAARTGDRVEVAP